MSWPVISKKIAKQFELISASWHEAAHTIYAFLHLMKVSSVSIFEDKKLKRIDGLTCYEYPSDFNLIKDLDLFNKLIKADIGMSYAGLIAEKHLFKSISGSQQTPLFISAGSSNDNKVAREMISKYNLAPPGKKRAAFKAKLIREVQNELHLYWDDATIVAHDLFKRRKLSYQDLQKLLIKKSKNKIFWKEQFKNINYFYENREHLDENYLRIII
jgi:hypothetical protein